MPQRFTHLLNKTVYTLGSAGEAPPPSASVRFQGLTRDSYVEVHSLHWGVTSSDEGALLGYDFQPLQILRNEIFERDFQYGVETVGDVKDVIFHDNAWPRTRYREVRFKRPMKLNDADSYLIVVTAPIRIGDPGSVYRWALTVKGRFVSQPRTVK